MILLDNVFKELKICFVSKISITGVTRGGDKVQDYLM